MSTAAFDGAPERGTINFGVAQPSADLLPLELMKGASARFFMGAQPLDLNYGERQGDVRFRTALAAFLNASPGCSATLPSLMLSGGTSQALDFLCGIFTRPGDTVFVEEPSYVYAFPIFRDHGLNLVPVPLDAGGMHLEQFERLLAKHRPKFVYTIPSFHNPTGRTLDQARRERLVALSSQHGFIIVADEVYQLLYYNAPPPTSFGALIEQGNVLSLGSFAKILAPGLRLGWIQAGTELMRQLCATGALISGGNFNRFTSHLVSELMGTGELARFVIQLRKSYAARADAMNAALHQHLDGIARWDKPDGGYFFWLSLRDGANAAHYEEAARAAGTGFLPGSACTTTGELKHCLRLSFAHYQVPEIHEGIARLGRALQS